ncbi:MAG: hypothetical protein IKB10_01275 [Alphaproteobacteria bacterium]|nr:hypothetical protein [Alphaproteobacteria bacterium]MBR6598031.1 hypothetical protein [Alphaproteobacteria bacterium]
MNNFLKLTGVSMLAIVAASNANAAGYTCEELIEYTSCNDGYYLNSGKCIEGSACAAGNYLQGVCPDDYTYSDSWCAASFSSWTTGLTQAECEDIPGESYWYGPGCLLDDTWPDELGDNDFIPSTGFECTECAAGTYQNVAGQYSCITCPAGSECPTAGLASHTLCEVGEYSFAGATTCLTCPTHKYTNASGQSVTVSATSKAGAAGANECYIGPDTYFTDKSGTYHFKSNCSLGDTLTWKTSVSSAEECAIVAATTGENWVWTDYEGEYPFACRLQCPSGDCDEVTNYSYLPQTESECNQLDGEFEWLDGKCKNVSCEELEFGQDGLGCFWI